MSEAWRAHASGEKQLPWEDAARLEYAWIGHCDSTKFNASRFFEETVLELAGSRDMTIDNVAKSLQALKAKSVLTNDLFLRADRVRIERNKFTHTAELKADLDYTLRLISVMREVAALGQSPSGGSWGTEKGTEWTSVLTVAESEAYVRKASKLLRKNADKNSNGNIWVGSLMQSLPPTIDEIPLGLMEQLVAAPELTTGHQFNDVLSELVRKGLKTWIDILAPQDGFSFPESMLSLMSLLEQAGMARELANLKESYLKRLEKLTTFDEFVNEVKMLEGGDMPFTREEFSIRWKRSVKESNFLVSFENLASITPHQFDLITKNVKTDLFIRAVRTELKNIKDGDVKRVKSVCDELEAFAGKNQQWYTIAREKDGFTASEMDNKIRAGGNPVQLGRLVDSLMPFVDAENFPKMNGRFETIIERGEKEARKNKEDDK